MEQIKLSQLRIYPYILYCSILIISLLNSNLEAQTSYDIRLSQQSIDMVSDEEKTAEQLPFTPPPQPQAKPPLPPKYTD